MKIEIYNQGKLIKSIDKGEIHALTKYVGVNLHGDVTTIENKITLGIGTKDYWFCIAKMSLEEAEEFSKLMKKLTLQFDDKDQIGGTIK